MYYVVNGTRVNNNSNITTLNNQISAACGSTVTNTATSTGTSTSTTTSGGAFPLGKWVGPSDTSFTISNVKNTSAAGTFYTGTATVGGTTVTVNSSNDIIWLNTAGSLMFTYNEDGNGTAKFFQFTSTSQTSTTMTGTLSVARFPSLSSYSNFTATFTKQ
jgi:hypothetical protein